MLWTESSELNLNLHTSIFLVLNCDAGGGHFGFLQKTDA